MTRFNIIAILSCLVPTALLVIGLQCSYKPVFYAGLVVTVVLLLAWAVPMARWMARKGEEDWREKEK
jgi:hypothetical protein